MADLYPTILSKVTATKECILQWTRDLEEIKSGREAFDEEVQALNAKIQQERERNLTTSGHEERSVALDKVIQYTVQTRELELKYRADAKERECVYQRRLEVHLQRLSVDISGILGTPPWKELPCNLSNGPPISEEGGSAGPTQERIHSDDDARNPPGIATQSNDIREPAPSEDTEPSRMRGEIVSNTAAVGVQWFSDNPIIEEAKSDNESARGFTKATKACSDREG
jgi:hypothetical protein